MLIHTIHFRHGNCLIKHLLTRQITYKQRRLPYNRSPLKQATLVEEQTFETNHRKLA